jgi:heptose III glucuronosyltransferase
MTMADDRPANIPENSAPLLSLVVPVYNVAPFLPRCLDSLIDTGGISTEVILVDDGSTDECPAILARYAAQYPHFYVIRQENGGLSAARNTGIEHARGEYIAFVDSDDYVAPGYHANLVRLASSLGVPMAVGNGIYEFNGNRDNFSMYLDNLPRGIMASHDLLKRRLRDQTFLHMVWLHLYRRDFIESHKLRFVPRLIHEDVPWTTRALLLAKNIAYDPTPGYFYRQRIRRFEKYKPADLDNYMMAIIKSSVFNAREISNMATEVRDDPELQSLLRWQLVDGGLSIFHKLEKISSPALRRAIYRYLREEKLFALLWAHAADFRQHRKIARNFLKSCLLG